MKKKLAVCFSLLAISSCSKPTNLTSLYDDILFQKEISESKINLDKEHNDGVWNSKKISFQNSSLKLLQVEQSIIKDEQSALINFNTKNVEIQEMYSTQATPYSGSVTNESSCLDNVNLRPKIVNTDNQTSYSYQLKSTDRFVFGVCVEEQNIYKAQLINLWCKKSKKFYSITLFYNKSEATKTDDIVKCN